MTIESKLLGVSPSGAAANVADVFSTYLYTGTGANQTITNNIDLAGEGGLVWIKDRTTAQNHALSDTERGATKWLSSNENYAQDTLANGLTSFNADGFSVGTNGGYNANGSDIVSWTFRKKEKFFDIVTYTGTGSAQSIPHTLGSIPGCIFTKSMDDTNSWAVYHRGNTSAPETQRLILEKNYATSTDSGYWNDTAPTDTHFTVGNTGTTNQSGANIVAYIFADNSTEDADDQMIRCGSAAATGLTTVNLGFEPQFVLIKSTTVANSWYIFDSMRGLTTDSGPQTLSPNGSYAEYTESTDMCNLTSTGFTFNSARFNGNSTYIYMAVRAPMMVEPEAATDVFDVAMSLNPAWPTFISSFPVDMSIHKDTTAGTSINGARLVQDRKLEMNSVAAEGSGNTEMMYDFMNGFYKPIAYGSPPGGIGGTAFVGYMWKRAKGYFDVVPYTGNGVSGRTVAHSLGVAPEMIWVKSRSFAYNWLVMPNDATKYAYLNYPNGASVNSAFWLDTDPTSTEFTVSANAQVNGSAKTYIAYLFASLAGISKVGNYTGNGSYQTIDCGFAAGSRFILIKRTDATGDWYVWDSVRGIVAGNDPHLALNTSAAQVTTDDSVDPDNSGFIVNQNSATNINVTSSTYIFYAIA